MKDGIARVSPPPREAVMRERETGRSPRAGMSASRGGGETRAILSAWQAQIDGFCERTGRPEKLYRPGTRSSRSRFEITALRTVALRKLCSQERIPYWREMRTDEMRAALIIMGSNG